jgi:hypothetical protein
MRATFAVVAFLFATQAFATSIITPQQVNEAGLSALLANSERMTDQDGVKVSDLLSRSLLTSATTHNKISNECAYDRGDQLYKCELTILNADDKAKGRTESSLSIRYELEADSKTKMPSKDLFTLSVNSMIAG